ncbi:MAG: hypothetical protein L6R41_004880 [Letrouitia leprolyta]|nr:MAG: hypothetical protein L6R41_004880 [Letrouitia leprolyta]
MSGGQELKASPSPTSNFGNNFLSTNEDEKPKDGGQAAKSSPTQSNGQNVDSLPQLFDSLTPMKQQYLQPHLFPMSDHPSYNPDLPTIHACEVVLGYTFHNPFYLQEALLAAGSHLTFGPHPRFRSGNKRLAIIGDRVLDLLLSLQWYPTWEERLTFDTLRNDVTSNMNLEAVGVRNGLGRFVDLAMGARVVTQRTMTATVEAVVGAAYLDGGMGPAEVVVKKLGILDRA